MSQKGFEKCEKSPSERMLCNSGTFQFLCGNVRKQCMMRARGLPDSMSENSVLYRCFLASLGAMLAFLTRCKSVRELEYRDQIYMLVIWPAFPMLWHDYSLRWAKETTSVSVGIKTNRANPKLTVSSATSCPMI